MADLGLLVIRVVFGLSFVGYGLQTLFGWLGGDGLKETAKFFESVGLRPAKHLAILDGAGEIVAGLLFTVGLLTPFAGAVMAFIMFVAIIAVAAKERYWTSGTYQHCVAIVAASIGVALTGPGAYSLDALIGL